MSRRKKKAAKPLERYSLEFPEYNNPEVLLRDECKRCLCMMCLYFFDGCRRCPFCLFRQHSLKYCDYFKPLVLKYFDYETHYNFEW